MKSITAELAAIDGHLPAYPESPQITTLAEEIAVFVGRRSDQVERSVHPSTVFEMELDAEVQELSRQYARLQTSVHDYLARHRAVATVRARILYAVVGLTIALCAIVTWSARPKSSTPELSQQPPLGAPQVAAAGSPLPAKDASAATAAIPSLPLSSSPTAPTTATETKLPVLPASTSSSQAIAPSSVLVQGPKAPPVPLHTSVGPPSQPHDKTAKDADKKADTKEAKIFAVEDNSPEKSGSQDPAPSATQSAKVVDATPVKKVVDPVSIKSQPVAKVVTKPVRSDDAAEKSAKNTVDDSKSAGEAKAKPPANEHAGAIDGDTTKPSSEDAVKPPRKDHYGSSGVVTLMPSGVVVFDIKTKSQKLVPIGAKMPDGSILKGVDAKASRIKTDKGDVEFE